MQEEQTIQIDLKNMLQMFEDDKIIQTKQPAKPIPPNVYKETAAHKNYIDSQTEAQKEKMHQTKEWLNQTKNKRTTQKLQVTQTQFKKSNINFFDKKTTIDTDLMIEEKRRAKMLAMFGTCRSIKHPDGKQLIISTTEIHFSKYESGNTYNNKFRITNPSKHQQSFQFYPPLQPFYINKLNGNIMPGQFIDIDVYFKPTSYQQQRSDIRFKSQLYESKINIVACNQEIQFVLKQVIIDNQLDLQNKVVIQEDYATTTKDGQTKIIDIILPELIKLYDKPHILKLFIENDDLLYKEDTTKPTYYQKQKPQYLQNMAHVSDIMMQSSNNSVNYYLNQDNCVLCHFADEDKLDQAAELDIDQLDKMDQFYYLEQTSGLNGYKLQQQPEQQSQQQYQMRIEPRGVICLNIEFDDSITQEDKNQLLITTLEQFNLQINFQVCVSTGMLQITKIDNVPLVSKPIISIDLNNEQFLNSFKDNNYQLGKQRILPIKREIIVNSQTQDIDVLVQFEIDGLKHDNLKLFLRKYQENLMLGYLSDNYADVYNGNYFVIKNDVETIEPELDQSEPKQEIIKTNQMTKQFSVTFVNDSSSNETTQIIQLQKLQKSSSQTHVQGIQSNIIGCNGILDLSYIVNNKIYTLFRFILQLDIIQENYNIQILKRQAHLDQQKINQIYEQIDDKTTDYLLISQPSWDMGIFQVSEGKTFVIDIKNQSKNTYIPFIVAPNLHCQQNSIISKPQDLGVKFKWIRLDDIEESEIVFPDILDVFSSKYKEWQNQITQAYNGFPQNYPSIKNKFKSQTMYSTRQIQNDNFNYMMKIPFTNRNRNFNANYNKQDEVEPIQTFPQCGILAPQQKIKINVKVTPISVGDVQAFIVINTPGQVYYENIYNRINQIIDQQQVKLVESGKSSRNIVKQPLMNLSLKLNQQQNSQTSQVGMQQLNQSTNLESLNKINPIMEKYRSKTIPIAEQQRLFTPINKFNNQQLESGFLSERDVCCRVYGCVAIPQIAFSVQQIKPTSDQQKPLQLEVVNHGQAQTEIELVVLKGDAMFVPNDQMPVNYAASVLQAWAHDAKLLKQFKIVLDTQQHTQINVLPGTEDSVIVALKHKSAFGNMINFLDQNLIDLKGNFVCAGCKILKRLEPLKPYIYLSSEPDTKYIVLSPVSRNMKEMTIRTRPYSPVEIMFTIVNPASQQFNCEIQTGRDLVAPSVIKLGPEQKAFASFAVNPDRSGEMETFITFHDCNMRILVNAYGPDITLRCPSIRNFDTLIQKQGMVLNQSLYSKKQIEEQKQNDKQKTLQWDDLLENIPQNIKIDDICQADVLDETVMFNNNLESENIVQASAMQQVFNNDVIDFTTLTQSSSYQKIIDDLPYIKLENNGSTNSKEVNITVFNPTASSLYLDCKPVPLDRQFLTLSLVAANQFSSRQKLQVGGLFFNSKELQSQFFVTNPQNIEIQKNKSFNVVVRATNMKNFSKYQSLLQINNLFIKLICEREPPKVKLCDDLQIININTSYQNVSCKLTDCISLEQTNQLSKYKGQLFEYDISINATCEQHIGIEIQKPFCFLSSGSQQYNFTINQFEKKKIQIVLLYKDLKEYIEKNIKSMIQTFQLKNNSYSRNDLIRTQNKSMSFLLQNKSNNSDAKGTVADTIQNIVNNQLNNQQINGTLIIKNYDCPILQDQNQQDQYFQQQFPLNLKLTVPKLDNNYVYNKFNHTFKNKQSLIINRLYNVSNYNLKFKIIHVPINQVVNMLHEQGISYFNLDEFENIQDMIDRRQQIQANYVLRVINATESTFVNKSGLYYDSLNDQICVDCQNLFQFNFTEGSIEQSYDKQPFKYIDLQCRFQPEGEVFDMTKDRVVRICYQSFYYIVVDGGWGTWVRCSGSINTNVDQI